MIRDFRISPSWGDIPLPPGTNLLHLLSALVTLLLHATHVLQHKTRASLYTQATTTLYYLLMCTCLGRSLNSCQTAFYGMCQQNVQPSMNLGAFNPHRHDPSVSSAAMLEGSATRKRPLYPSDKPILAPRAIQPRPPTSATSFSSESGASTHLSSFENLIRGEPPRKRGRPSKAETERRKAAAEARGETYPPPRRSGTGRIKQESTPNSPAGTEHMGTSIPLNTSASAPQAPNPEVRHEPPPGRTAATMPPSGDDKTRHAPERDRGPTIRELPRPTDVRQILPSPHALQLGTRGPMPRVGTADRPFEPFLSRSGIPRSEPGSRQILVDSASRTPPQPSVSSPGVTSGPSAERRSE